MSKATVDLSVRGDSMAPFIRPGERVTVRITTQVGIGDVVLALDPTPRVHRVIGILRRNGETHVITCGDRSRDSDPAVPASAILGRVIAVNGRPVRNWLARPLAWLSRWQAGTRSRNHMARWSRRVLRRFLR